MNFSGFTAAVIHVFYLVIVGSSAKEECNVDDRREKVVSLFVRSERNQTGDWVTRFALNKDDPVNDAVNKANLDLSQALVECDGKRTLQIRGVLTGISSNDVQQTANSFKDKLRFHTACGSSVAVLNDGRTLQKIDADKDGNMLALTNRPMRSNEVLEIRLEKKNSKIQHSLGLGLTTELPRAASTYRHINGIVNQSWALYDGVMFQNGKKTVESYGVNFNSFSEGTRFGVMRSNTGSLHYFINGEDQGPAASNVPYPVYGVVELRGHALMMTIVDA